MFQKWYSVSSVSATELDAVFLGRPFSSTAVDNAYFFLIENVIK